ncbi:2'-5' RNA ligase superfamily protein [Streptomyces zhaozhouensis]|uniref:2'-5' RNA ligase superfamily protein n=1 Tax=Streptomyces zhaozhouensis TaxID=1300267 RepID=A0A286E840_9ACTN|nr:2'-5' RNA ligase family protein [Streptomyces zhaozhouensis]SOD67088.1 2'-5' RNA ligase superfamily protein [Streptomyces zhaozhouensis]
MNTSTVADFFGEIETRHHAWPAGRADLHWHLLFDPATTEQHLVEPYRAITHHPGLAPVPARWLHLTVLHAGPVANYQPDELAHVTKLVADECASLKPFDLLIDRPSVGRVAIECAARPGAPARRLWELTSNVDAAVTGGRNPLIPNTYYPHLSLAYGTAGPHRATRTTLKAILSDLPGGPVTLRATHLSLVAQSHDRHHITWTPITNIPLGNH